MPAICESKPVTASAVAPGQCGRRLRATTSATHGAFATDLRIPTTVPVPQLAGALLPRGSRRTPRDYTSGRASTTSALGVHFCVTAMTYRQTPTTRERPASSARYSLRAPEIHDRFRLPELRLPVAEVDRALPVLLELEHAGGGA